MDNELIKKSYAIGVYGSYCIDLYEIMNRVMCNNIKRDPYNLEMNLVHNWLCLGKIVQSQFSKPIKLKPNTYLDDIIEPLISTATIIYKNNDAYLNKDSVIKLDKGLKQSVEGWLTTKEVAEAINCKPRQVYSSNFRRRYYKSITYYNLQEILEDIRNKKSVQNKKEDVQKNSDLYLFGNNELYIYLLPYIKAKIIREIRVSEIEQHGPYNYSISQFEDCLLNPNITSSERPRELIYIKSKVKEKIQKIVQAKLNTGDIYNNIKKLLE